MTRILIKKRKIDFKKKRSHSIVSAISNDVFLDTEKHPRKEIKSFFPIKFKQYVSQEQKGIFINAMNLYNGRNKNIKFFEDRIIKPFTHASDAKSELKECDGVKKNRAEI